MTSNLPSQKLFFIFIPVILLMGIFALFFRGEGKAPEQVKDGAEIVAIERELIDEKDSDGDGLRDWEESIWKTNPNDPNTHGKPDAEYVAEEARRMENAPTGSLTFNGSIETTDELGKALFSEYIALKQTGQVNAVSIAQLTDRIADSVMTSEIETDFTMADVRTFSNFDQTRLRVYATALMQTRERYANTFANQVNRSGNVSFTEDTALAADFYGNMAQEIISLEVPEGVREFHVQYANALKASAVGLAGLSNMENDPLKSLTGIEQHMNGQNVQAASISRITAFLNASGIIDFTLLPL